MKLIDADALRLMKVEECEGHTIDYAAGWKACIEWIKTLPTVDAVPVVRCKDCKHYLTEDVECPCNIGLADATPDAQYTWTPEPDWFCADGERRAE